MKVTNKFNIPGPLYKAILNDDYTKGSCDVTVTTLLKPVQMILLEKKHADEIEFDVLDNLCVFLGRSLHKGLEEAESEALVEQRFYKTFNVKGIGDITLGGCVDYFDPFSETICDYKLTNVFGVRDGLKPEWIYQLNAYAHLVRANGMPVSNLQICAILKDWSKSQASNNPDYPQQPVLVMPVPVWSDPEAEDYIQSRLQAYAYGLKDGCCFGCTDEELWKQPDIWKVFKGSNIRATKCFDTELEAKMFIESQSESDKYRIQFFPGKRQRCEGFCKVSRWCPQNQLLAGKGK